MYRMQQEKSDNTKLRVFWKFPKSIFPVHVSSY